MKTVELLNIDEFNYFDLQNVPEWNDEGMKVMEEKVLITYLRKQLQEMMSDLVSIVRSNDRLKLAQKKQKKSSKQ
jgi:L-aspartate oxidase